MLKVSSFEISFYKVLITEFIRANGLFSHIERVIGIELSHGQHVGGTFKF